MSNNNLYYDNPMQVKYFKDGYYYGAIVYHDFLINGAGEVFQIKEILKQAANTGMLDPDLVIVEFDWVDLNDIILYGKAL